MFKGTATALITPFTEDGIDYEAFEKLLEDQINNGIDALLVAGTTGEPPTMTHEEKMAVVDFAIKKINHRVPVIVGTGTNCTRTSIEATIEAARHGADGALCVTPYYNKCTQNGLYLHYKAIADASPIPVIAYNVPPRTGVNIQPETLARLTDIKNMAGIKDACGNAEQIVKMAKACEGSNIKYYSGDDEMIIEAMQAGGAGLFSVASNILPAETASIVNACMKQDYARAQVIFEKYKALFAGLFYEVNPIPVKYAASRMGICKNILRMPLTPMSEDKAAKLDILLKELNLI